MYACGASRAPVFLHNAFHLNDDSASERDSYDAGALGLGNIVVCRVTTAAIWGLYDVLKRLVLRQADTPLAAVVTVTLEPGYSGDEPGSLQHPLPKMSALGDDAILRRVLEHVKPVVQRERNGVPIFLLERVLAELPERALGRFEPSMYTIRLAIRKFPDALYITPDGRVHSYANARTTSRTSPPVKHASKPHVQNGLTRDSSAKTTAEGNITAVKERNYGFIVTYHPAEYTVFYHLRVTSGWPPGSEGPRVGDPVEVELARGPPGHKCKYIAKAVRYAGSMPAEAQIPRNLCDQRVISDRVGVITFIRPDRGIIKFGDADGESAFFNKKSMPKALLRRGETLMDVFSAGDKVCFEAQWCPKDNSSCGWYATVVTTVQRGIRSVIFDDGDSVSSAQPKTAIEGRNERVPPSTGAASQPTRSSRWGDTDNTATENQRQGYAAPHTPSFEVQPPQKPDNVSHQDSPMYTAQHCPTSEAQVFEIRQSQCPSQATVPSRKQRSVPYREPAETSGEAAGGRPQIGGGGFDVETALQLATAIRTTLLPMFQEELTFILNEELGLTIAEL